MKKIFLSLALTLFAALFAVQPSHSSSIFFNSEQGCYVGNANVTAVTKLADGNFVASVATGATGNPTIGCPAPVVVVTSEGACTNGTVAVDLPANVVKAGLGTKTVPYTALCSGTYSWKTGGANPIDVCNMKMPPGYPILHCPFQYSFLNVFGSEWPGKKFQQALEFKMGYNQYLSIPFTVTDDSLITFSENQSWTFVPIIMSFADAPGKFNRATPGVVFSASQNPSLSVTGSSTATQAQVHLVKGKTYFMNIAFGNFTGRTGVLPWHPACLPGGTVNSGTCTLAIEVSQQR